MADLSDSTIDAMVERLAPRLAEELAARGQQEPAGGELVDAHTIARLLGVTRSFVYQHARELGGQRLGDGPRARWRFDPERAKATHHERTAPVNDTPPRPRRRAARRSTPTLTVRDPIY